MFGAAAFCFKEELFAVILASKEAGFITYRLLQAFSGLVMDAETPDFFIQMINTGLAIHYSHESGDLCRFSICIALCVLSIIPFRITGAVYQRMTLYRAGGGAGYLLSVLGALVSYYLIFPLTFPLSGDLSGE